VHCRSYAKFIGAHYTFSCAKKGYGREDAQDFDAGLFRPFDRNRRLCAHRPVTTLRHELARLRTRYRAILREEVRGTVRDATEVDEELRYLCRVLAATRPLTPTHALAKKDGRTPKRARRLGNGH
jgi:hypothetical protein